MKFKIVGKCLDWRITKYKKYGVASIMSGYDINIKSKPDGIKNQIPKGQGFRMLCL